MGEAQSLALAAFRHVLSMKLQRQHGMVAPFSSFPARGAGREQPSLAFPNRSVNAAQQIFVRCLGFFGRIEKDF